MNIGSISDSEANASSVIVNDALSSKNDSKEIRDIYHIPCPVLCAEESRVCPIINKVVHEQDCKALLFQPLEAELDAHPQV